MSSTGEHLVEKFFPGTGASYDRVVRWTTWGRDAAWKRRVLALLPPSRRVLELAGGTGILTRMLLEAQPGVRVTAVDITDDYQAIARERFAGDARVEFLLGDATKVDLARHGPFDALVTCYLPKYVDPDRLLENVGPALAPGATLVLHDFDKPRAWLPWLLWRAWFGVVDLVAPRLHPEWGNVFDRSLLRLISTVRWPHAWKAALRRHGYEEVRHERLFFSTARLVVARKPRA